jgi:hypothetical protein
MLPDTLRLSKQSELIEMSTQGSSGNGNGGPSVKERVRAMHHHIDVFKMIAEYPQTGIYVTFQEEFAQARAFAESEVFRSSRAAKCYLQRSVQPEDPSPDEADYRRVMMDLVSSLLYLGEYYHMFQSCVIANVIGSTHRQGFSADKLV